jgi:gluconolactonase
VYVCNNGGFEWRRFNGLLLPGRAPADYTTGRIERVNLTTGKFERVYESFEGERLCGPNDLVFDADGAIWFTDLGKRFPRHRDHSGLFYARADGSLLQRAVYPALALNGVGLSPDGRTVYCNETDTGRLWAYDIESAGRVKLTAGRGRLICTLPGYQMLDSLAVEASGRICSATLMNGGITVFDPDGSFEHTPFPDPMTTNICFAGADLQDAYITLSGSGRLVRTRWPRPGLKLSFNG